MRKALFQGDKLIFFDGAMGTMLQAAGWSDGTPPEICNLLRPELVEFVHKSYTNAGANVITANTFGANALKLQPLGYSVKDVVKAGVTLAEKKTAGNRPVALDAGPLGQLMAPMGPLKFQDAVSLFAEQMKVGQEAGADLILIETMSDLYEAKAAVLAAKEVTSLPIICSLTFQKNGKTLMGNDPMTVVTVLEALGVDGIGVNCSLGPKELMPVIKQLLKHAHVPLLVQANAGLPELIHGKVTYPMTPVSFADFGEEMVRTGIKILGGCCGTTPPFIKELRNRCHNRPWIKPNNPRISAVASSRQALQLDGFHLVGQRINPSGRSSLLQGLHQGDLDVLYEDALLQKQAGAEILDINVLTGQTSEKEDMIKAVEYIQSMIPVPLQLSSADAGVLEAGVRVVNGKPILNSVNASIASMSRVLPLARKYGACIIGMTIDEEGIPSSAEGRLALAENILAGAISYGIPKEDLMIDCVVESDLLQPAGAEITLKALKLVREKLGLKTTLGISNISYGMKEREDCNAAFLAMAMKAGLNLAVADPLSEQIINLISR